MARGGGGRGGGGGGFSGGGGFGGGRGGGSSFGGSRGGGSRLGGGSSRGRGGPSRNSTPGSSGGFGSGGGGYRPRGLWGPRPFFGGWGGYGQRYGRRRYGPGGGGGCGGCGCFGPIIGLFFILIIFNFMWASVPGSNNSTAIQTVQVNSSTIEREPIEAGLVNETDYYIDNLDWIGDRSTMEAGLRYFYEETNIQPVVYITDNINGEANPAPEEIDAFAQNLYDELFTDEAHLLLVHFENYDFYNYEYSYHTVYGSQAKVLMDNEAEDILFDYLDYHYPRDISEEEFFSEAFRDTADRIMTVTRSPWIPVLIIIGGAVIIFLLYTWWRRALGGNSDDSDKKTGSKTTEQEKTDTFKEFDF